MEVDEHLRREASDESALAPARSSACTTPVATSNEDIGPCASMLTKDNVHRDEDLGSESRGEMSLWSRVAATSWDLPVVPPPRRRR